MINALNNRIYNHNIEVKKEQGIKILNDNSQSSKKSQDQPNKNLKHEDLKDKASKDSKK